MAGRALGTTSRAVPDGGTHPGVRPTPAGGAVGDSAAAGHAGDPATNGASATHGATAAPPAVTGSRPDRPAAVTSAVGRDARASRLPWATSPTRAGARRRTPRWVFLAAGAVLPVLVLVAWHVVTTTGIVPAHRLPTPWSVVQAGVDLWQRGDLQTHVAISTQRVLLGFAFGSVLGLAFGALVGLSRWGAALLSPSIGAVRAVPSLAWVPLLILWIGINEDSKVTLVTIGAFFPVFTMVASALRHVDKHLVEAGRAFGLRGLRLLRTVQLPAVVPSVVSGLRLALAQAWLFVVAAELIAASMGLGFLLTDSQNNGRIDRMLLAIVAFAALGKFTDFLLGIVERTLLKRWA